MTTALSHTAPIHDLHGGLRALPVPPRAAVPADRVRRPYLVALPDLEPPFDDELDEVRRALPEQHRRWTPPGPPVTTPTGSAVSTRSVRSARSAPSAGTATALQPARVPSTGAPVRIRVDGVPAWSQEAAVGVRRTSTAALPAARRSASVLARALVEVLAGQRAVTQLRVHCSAEVYAGLVARPAPASSALAHLLSVHVCEPADGVAEVTTVFRRAGRTRAAAFRLQGVDGRWRVTALQVG